MENIFRLDEVVADDSCVDAKHDKGIDAIYVDDVAETVYLVQAKTKTKDTAKLGDTDIKEFYGSIQQFNSEEKVNQVASETSNSKLKQTIERTRLADKVASGYSLVGVFISNVPANDDAHDIIDKLTGVELFDAVAIAENYVDLAVAGGVQENYFFDVSDSDVISYNAGGAEARLFLAPALNLLKMSGISDGALFEQNVRLALGNTKVNRGLRKSIAEKTEHKNFPLYHNGINVLCESIISESDERIEIRNYVVVNGAQSLTSLRAEKSKITEDLKILVKLIETKGDAELSQRITTNSNNQNAIKARDLKSNHSIQQRLKTEVLEASKGSVAYEIKQGEINNGVEILKNETAGLILLAMDLDQPWSCHQKYKVMDDLHANIFGRPDVNGARIYGFWLCFSAVESALEELDDQLFAHYNLTKFFLAHVVVSLIQTETAGKDMLNNIGKIIAAGRVDEVVEIFRGLAAAIALDLNAETLVDEGESFDYKNELKSPTWCKKMTGKLIAQYRKDVIRKKADPISGLCAGLAALK